MQKKHLNKKKYKATRTYQPNFNHKKKTSWQIFLDFLFFIFIISSIGTCLYFLLFSPFFKITQVEIDHNPNGVLSEKEIKNLISNAIEKQQISNLEANNFFLLRTHPLKKDILEQNNLIEGVIISKKAPNKIIVSIQEKQPIAIWCKDECFLVDKNGYSFYKANDYPNKDTFLTFEENKTILIDKNKNSVTEIFDPNLKEKLNLNEKIAPKKLINYIVELERILTNNNIINITKIAVPEKDGNQAEILTSKNFKLLISTDEKIYPPEQTADIISNLLDDPNFFDDNIIYIDLRIAKKAFICRKDKECASLDTI